MKTKLLYKIASGEDATVQKEVNELLEKGWMLYGSLAMAIDPGNKVIICAQALTKEEAPGPNTL